MEQIRRQIDQSIEYLKNRLHLIFILITVLFFFNYIISPQTRNYIAEQKIDANFVLGFLTVIALMVTALQGLKDRRLTYNLSVLESVRNNGLEIIAKLIAIKEKSRTIVTTLRAYKEAIKNGQHFVDYNETLSKKDIEEGFQLVAAYADTYFRDECKKWNEMLDKISIIATDNANVIKNYEVNLHLILAKQNFSNPTLNALDEILLNAEKTAEEIDQITAEMRNNVIEKINNISEKIKNDL